MKGKITKKQLEILKENIEKMAKSEEQFLIMIFKNKNGTDNITSYGYNLPKDKLAYFLRTELNRAEMRE